MILLRTIGSCKQKLVHGVTSHLHRGVPRGRQRSVQAQCPLHLTWARVQAPAARVQRVQLVQPVQRGLDPVARGQSNIAEGPAACQQFHDTEWVMIYAGHCCRLINFPLLRLRQPNTTLKAICQRTLTRNIGRRIFWAIPTQSKLICCLGGMRLSWN